MKDFYSSKNIEHISKYIKNLVKIIDEFGTEHSLKSRAGEFTPSPIQKVSNDFLHRLILKLKAIDNLLPLYSEDHYQIHSIGLLLRTILSDFLTFLYLASFNEPEAEEQRSLANELVMLERDFYESMIEASKVETDFAAMNGKDDAEVEKEYDERIKRINEIYKHLFLDEDTTKRIKKAEEIRATSNRALFINSNELKRPNRMVSEKYKYDHLNDVGFNKYKIVFSMFKFFSQFQHYSKHSINMLRDEFRRFSFYYFILTLDLTNILVDFHFNLYEGAKDQLEKLRELKNELATIFLSSTGGPLCR